MKKKLMVLATLLMMVVTMNAQSIIGIWQANIPAAEFGLLLVFEEDSQASIVIVGDIKESDMSAKMLMGVPGTYKKEGNILSLNMKKEEAEIDFAELKLSGELEGKEEMVKGLLKSAMDGEKEELFADFDFDKATIKTLTADTMELVVEGEEQPFVFNRVQE